MSKRWIPLFLSLFAVWACSNNKNPHRPVSPPFDTVSLDESKSNLSVVEEFEYDGPTVQLRGSVEKILATDEIRLKGIYRTTRDLEPGTQLAIQVYDVSGQLLVRDLPRIPFSVGEDGFYVARMDQAYPMSDWAIGFDTDSVVIQFNYIKEGEFWYDIKYPDIELPSIRIEKVNMIERFDVSWGLIPRIIPRGIGNYLPIVFLARKAHDENYYHHRSVEAFVGPEKARREQERRPVETSITLGEGRHLAIDYLRLEEPGFYLVRHGFVWDGVQWYENARTDNLTRVWVVPFLYYLLGMAMAYGLLYYFWRRSRSIGTLVFKFTVRGVTILASVFLAAWTFTNPYALLWGAFLPGFWIATRPYSQPVRLYILGLLLLGVLETSWSFLFANSSVRLSGFLLSLVAYSIILLPILLFKKGPWGGVFLGLASVVFFSGYMLLDIYYSFFKDYPSLRVLGYASQSLEVLDSIWSLVKDEHAVSIVILGWYWFCGIRVLRDPKGRRGKTVSG